MPNTPARPELPAPDCECGQSFNPMYHADTVRRLLADERRKALPAEPSAAMLDALRTGSRKDWPSDELCRVRYAALLAAIDKEPTT